MGKTNELNPCIEYGRPRQENYGNVVQNVLVRFFHRPVILKIKRKDESFMVGLCVQKSHLMDDDIVRPDVKVLLGRKLLAERKTLHFSSKATL